MQAIRVKPDEFKLNNFIEYISDNQEELLLEYPKEIRRICLVDRDYLDVILFDEDYEDINNSQDYTNLVLNEEYALLLTIAKTNENLDKLYFINGKKSPTKHFQLPRKQYLLLKEGGNMFSRLVGSLQVGANDPE